jgi:diguanylate cyclase (GGDEF)-like protein
MPFSGEERLRALLRHVSDTVTVFDSGGAVVWTGGAVSSGEDGLAHIHPEDRLELAGKLAELVGRPGAEIHSDYRVLTADGGYVYCEGVAVNLLDDPLVQGVVLTSRNITARKRNELFLLLQSRILEDIATSAPLEDTLREVIGLVEDTVAGATCTVDLDVANHEVAAAGDDPWSRPIVGITKAVGLGVLLVHGVGRPPTDHEAGALDVAGHLAAIAVERAAAEDRLARLALHDPLTALPNRTLLLDRLGTALRRMSRHDQSVAVLFLDLDRFKIVNDSLGHAAGDELLLAVAARLLSAVRPGDTVARFAGDEFVVVCEDVVDIAHVRTIAKRLESTLEAPFAIDGGDVVVTVSTGIALASSATDDPEALLRDADTAMYRAKVDGRGRVAVFDAAMRARAVARLQLEGELRQGLARGELLVHYQPVVDLQTGQVTGVEALARWRHPDREVLLPFDFLELAEATGLVVPLEEEVLARALADAARWRSRGIDLAVNASPVHLANPDYVARVSQALAKGGWPPDRLVVEFTERVLLEENSDVLATLAKLREMGVRLVVDDFGTGSSSLGVLHRFPVDGLKIDRTFVERLGTGDRDEVLVRAIVGVADALGLDVVAEGVETGQQLQVLRKLGCRQGQGYLLGPPVEAQDITLS